MSDAPSPKDRIEAIRWAREIVNNPTAVFLDTETTGLGSDAEVIDLAVVDLRGNVVINQLIRPLRQIPTDSIFIHGISNRDVAEAPLWREVAQRVHALLHQRSIVAYNAPFDRSMIDQSNRASSLEIVTGSWLCAMRAFTAFRRDCPEPPRAQGWHSLSTASRTFGFPVPAHRALSDAQACRAVVLRMAEAEPTF